VEPHPEPPSTPPLTGRKSALAFFAVIAALYLPGAVAQSALLPAGLAWTELFAFLLPALVAANGSNLRAVPYLRLGGARPATLVLAVLVGGAGYLFAGGIASLVQRVVPSPWVKAFDPSRLFEGPGWERLLLVGVAIVLAPICEEVAFRGYLQTTLSLRRRPATAIVGAAFLFALLHLNPVLFPALLALGIVFGWLTWRAGSIWPAVVAHATNNAITSVLVLTLERRPAPPPPLAAIGATLALGGTALALLLVAYRAATPHPPPATDAVVLRDPGDPSIRFSPARVPRTLVRAMAAGAALLGALLLGAVIAAAR
jgi:uncharacterized protein